MRPLTAVPIWNKKVVDTGWGVTIYFICFKKGGFFTQNVKTNLFMLLKTLHWVKVKVVKLIRMSNIFNDRIAKVEVTHFL